MRERMRAVKRKKYEEKGRQTRSRGGKSLRDSEIEMETEERRKRM